MTSLPFYLVDAFADRPFTGNPAVVMPLAAWPTDEWLQAVASEFNQAETAYVSPQDDGFALRWFTPAVEVDLCGHATLASAHALWTTGRAPPDQPLRFHTRSGVLTCTRAVGAIELDFPRTPAVAAPPPPELLAALGAAPRWVGRSKFDYLVELESAAAVRGLAPDFRRLAAVAARGLIATAPSDDPAYDFVSRFFAPAEGIDEDPVTGSAHCCLADYWGAKLGRAELTGYQASRRGGVVGVRLAGDRVVLRGAAVTVASGEWEGENDER